MVNPAHDTRVIVGGRIYSVRREFELLKGIEERFGPIGKLIDDVEAHNLKGSDLVDLYQIVLSKQPDQPSAEEIAAHIVDKGVVTAVSPIHDFLMMSWLGYDAWREIAEQLAGRADLEAAEEEAGKSVPLGGNSYSSPSQSAGFQNSSGDQPIGNSLLD